MKLRLRKDPMQGLPGAAKQAKIALRRILGMDVITICVEKREWSNGQPMWVAWVTESGEDEFGLCARADTIEHALWRLGCDFHTVVNRRKK